MLSPRKCSLPMVMLVAVGVLDYRLLVAGQQGNPCNMAQGRGTCRLLDRCQSVYQDLLSGKRPEFVCGFQGSVPVVCCPNDNGGGTTPTTSRPIWGTSRPTTARPTTTTSRIVDRRRPALQMCSVYAKEVYALVDPPVLVGERQPVNVSLCAITSKKLIVGGTKAAPKEFPHMTAVGYVSGNQILWQCGGTLISDRFVMTAAHCLFSVQWGAAQWVRVGDLNLKTSDDDAKPQNKRIAQAIRHPNFSTDQRYNDIALLRLESPVTFNAYVRPACLSVQSSFAEGEKAVATGWGVVDLLDDPDVGSDDLLKVTVPVVSYSRCRRFFENFEKLRNGLNDASQICAGQEGRDTCQGDSGGPLVVFTTQEECMYDVIGVTSLGQLCGSIVPAIYTRVSNYVSWIESTVWPNLVG